MAGRGTTGTACGSYQVISSSELITYTPASERTLALFKTPFEQELDPYNRWVKMASVVPWDEMAKVFFASMSADHGRASVDLRVVLGALLVKHVEGISDEDTIQYIQENIYAQYFVGLPSFQTAPVFVPHLLVEIRKRLGRQGAQRLNDEVLKQARRLKAIKHRAKPRKKEESDSEERGSDDHEIGVPDGEAEAACEEKQTQTDQGSESSQPRNHGTLKLDATVAPQHVGYPTDTRLLHEGRLYSEELIDRLYYGSGFWQTKPRTYRRVAHEKYLAFAKKRNPGKRAIKRTRGQQLRYLRRNLSHINGMLDELEQSGCAVPWKFWHWRRLWALQELYRQQDILHRDGRRRIDDRLVNIAQPYVRPIKRGKAGKRTEFGAKLNMSETEGFVRMDQVSFDNFNEGIRLEEQVESYRSIYGYYPEVVLVDRVYLNRENRDYLKARGIRHSGKPLGRPPELTCHEKQKRRKEQNKRSEIEGKFGQGKSKYGLDDIQTRRMDTSYACIGLILLAINAIKLSGAFFVLILSGCRQLWKETTDEEVKLIFRWAKNEIIGKSEQRSALVWP